MTNKFKNWIDLSKQPYYETLIAELSVDRQDVIGIWMSPDCVWLRVRFKSMNPTTGAMGEINYNPYNLRANC